MSRPSPGTNRPRVRSPRAQILAVNSFITWIKMFKYLSNVPPAPLRRPAAASQPGGAGLRAAPPNEITPKTD